MASRMSEHESASYWLDRVPLWMLILPLIVLAVGGFSFALYVLITN